MNNSGPPCPECNQIMVWDEGQCQSQDEPEIPAMWFCPNCGEELVLIGGHRL